jgi:branched-chain amino acid transport system ATP-binding protein
MTDNILEISELTVRFGALTAVNNVSFWAERGRITSVIGPNGAGKSSLFNLISGAIRPHAGRVRLDGRDVTGWLPDRLLAVGLSRSFQITNVFFELSVRENLRLAAQFVQPGPQLANVLRPVAASRAALARVDELVDQFALAPKLDDLAGYLSHGEQRRLEIAVSLASRPRLLLLDEPTQGMSQSDTQDTADLIKRLAGETSILLIEHDVDLVMDLSDHVVVMHQGAKLAEGTPNTVRSNPTVQAAYFGEHADAAAR